MFKHHVTTRQTITSLSQEPNKWCNTQNVFCRIPQIQNGVDTKSLASFLFGMKSKRRLRHQREDPRWHFLDHAQYATCSQHEGAHPDWLHCSLHVWPKVKRLNSKGVSSLVLAEAILAEIFALHLAGAELHRPRIQGPPKISQNNQRFLLKDLKVVS